jgi:hypothetical protein
MKKVYLIAFLLFSVLGFAQQKGAVEFGLLGGVGLSNVSGFDSFDGVAEFNYDPAFAYNFGGQLQYYFSRNLGLRARVLYERKGYEDEIIIFDGRNNQAFTNVELEYITVPVTVAYHFGNSLDWYVNFGLYGGFLNSARDTRFNTDQEIAYQNFDFGLAWSIGYRHQVTNSAKLFIELDGQNGFIDLFENRAFNDFRLNRTSLNLGVVFLLANGR